MTIPLSTPTLDYARRCFADEDPVERHLASGACFRFDRPDSTPISLEDAAVLLSITSADASGHGYYSLAQRAVLLARLAASRAGDGAACHALLIFLPCALGHTSAERATIESAIARGFGLQWPRAPHIETALVEAAPHLRASELTYLHRKAGSRLTRLRAGGAKAAVRITPWHPEHARKEYIGSWRVFGHMNRMHA